MKPNLIWGIRSNKCSVLKGVCRQSWAVFCSEVSQASGSGGAVSFLSNDGRSRSVSLLWFCLLVCTYLTLKTFSLSTDFLVVKGEALTACSHPYGIRPKDHSGYLAPDEDPQTAPDLFSQDCTERCPKMLAGNCLISRCASGVRGRLGWNLIKDLAAATS